MGDHSRTYSKTPVGCWLFNFYSRLSLSLASTDLIIHECWACSWKALGPPRCRSSLWNPPNPSRHNWIPIPVASMRPSSHGLDICAYSNPWRPGPQIEVKTSNINLEYSQLVTVKQCVCLFQSSPSPTQFHACQVFSSILQLPPCKHRIHHIFPANTHWQSLKSTYTENECHFNSGTCKR